MASKKDLIAFIIDYLSQNTIEVRSVDFQNDIGQIPNQEFVEHKLTGDSTITIRVVNMETKLKFHNAKNSD